MTFIDTIKQYSKLLITNYEIDDTELDVLISMVYNDIATSVSLLTFNQIITLQEGVTTYDLDELLYVDENDTTQFLGVYKIETECGKNVGKCWVETCKNTFCMVDNYECSYSNYRKQEYADDACNISEEVKVVFKRHVIPDINALTTVQETAIQQALIEGVVEKASELIPSPTSSPVPMNEEGYRHSRYEQEKVKLLNKFPQYL